MIGFFSAYDENEKQADKKKITFVHIKEIDDSLVEAEMRPYARQFALNLNLEKVYLFYGKDKKIVYDYSL